MGGRTVLCQCVTPSLALVVSGRKWSSKLLLICFVAASVSVGVGSLIFGLLSAVLGGQSCSGAARGSGPWPPKWIVPAARRLAGRP